jgi:hypothetical protein
MLTLFPGTVDVDKWERCFGDPPPEVEGIPITRHWLIPSNRRPTSKETPEKYEAYVDLEPSTWTKIRIEVRGTQARQPRAAWRSGSTSARRHTSATSPSPVAT